MIVLAAPRNRNTSAALCTLYSMLYRIFNERLQDQFRYIVSADCGIHADINLQPPGKTPLLDLQIRTEKDEFLCDRHILLHADRGAQQFSELDGNIRSTFIVAELGAPLDQIERIIHKMRPDHLRQRLDLCYAQSPFPRAVLSKERSDMRNEIVKRERELTDLITALNVNLHREIIPAAYAAHCRRQRMQRAPKMTAQSAGKICRQTECNDIRCDNEAK